MKISNSLISLLVLGTTAFGSVLAGNAQQESPTPPASPKAPAVEMPITPSGASPESPPVTPPSTPSAAPSDAPSVAPAPSTEMTPKSGETPPASSGGGSLSEPTSSLSGGSASKVLAMCGSSSAPSLVESGSAPIGCRESKINAAPAAALK